MPRHAARHRVRPAMLVAVLALAGLVSTLLVSTWADAGPGQVAAPVPRSTAPPVAEPVVRRWEQVLGQLDAVRSRAFASSDPTDLRSVYVAGSRALARDRAALGAYDRRGLTLHAADLALLDVRVQRRRADRVRLRVVDRLRSTTAVTAGGRRLRLPVDRPTARLVTLARTDAGWRVAAVRPLDTD